MSNRPTPGEKPVREKKPSLKKLLDQCIATLTAPEEEQRKAVVRHLLRAALPAALHMIVERLVRVLRSDKVATRRQASASLVDIGEPAIPALSLVLLRTRNWPLFVAAYQTLATMMPSLAPAQQFKVFAELDIAQRRITDLDAFVAADKPRVLPEQGLPG